jgi:hypothetical protein
LVEEVVGEGVEVVSPQAWVVEEVVVGKHAGEARLLVSGNQVEDHRAMNEAAEGEEHLRGHCHEEGEGAEHRHCERCRCLR